MKIYAPLLCSLLILTGCYPVRTAISDNRNETHQTGTVSTRYDSIYIYNRDSISVLSKGDTVFVDKWHTRYRDILRQATDTLIKTDSIYIEKETVRTKEPSRMELFWQQTGKILLALALLYAAIKTIKKRITKWKS